MADQTRHCPTCQCNKLHPTMPTGPHNAPRSRSWHHDQLLPQNDVPLVVIEGEMTPEKLYGPEETYARPDEPAKPSP